MVRKVYLEPPWVMHSEHQRLVDYPPIGYEITVGETRQEKLFRTAARSEFLRFLLRSSDAVLPTGLVKSWLERRNTPPVATVLTYAVEHLVFRTEPWIMAVEFPFLPIGRHPKHLGRFKRIVERTLASPHCRRVLCQSAACRASLRADLDTRAFEEKLEVVYCSTWPRSVSKAGTGRNVKLLFVGASARERSFMAFEYKGGREVLEVFARLCREFDHLELVMRSDLPPDVKARYADLPRLRVIDEIVPWTELECEYQSADIFVFPSHTTIPMTLLEAMSYELPVVTIDSWANAEYIDDGETGLIAPRSQRLPYYYPGTHQVNFGTDAYARTVRRTDPDVVSELTKRVRLLVENAELRRRLGAAARHEVEHGRFSMEAANRRLGTIFDEAIGDAGR